MCYLYKTRQNMTYLFKTKQLILFNKKKVFFIFDNFDLNQK